jgi:AraC-like DNA-binding protein
MRYEQLIPEKADTIDGRGLLRRIVDVAKAIVCRRNTRLDQVPLAHFGIVCCRRQQRIADVPLLQPSLVLVLRGQKIIYQGEAELCCAAGNFLSIPAPSRFNMVNIPDPDRQEYLALFIPFELRLIERFLRLYNGDDGAQGQADRSLVGRGDALLYSAVLHYLEISDQPEQDPVLVEHRLLEVLLCLVKHCRTANLLLSVSPSLSKRLHALILTDPARSWRIETVCRMLATSESTLRRNLRKENASFQSVLDDVRLGLALSQVQCTDLPIRRIANNCGYQSLSRFTGRFQRRFHSTPTAMRKN